MKNKKSQIGMMIFVLVIVFIILCALFIIYGVQIETTRDGTHTGTVTAVEENGIIWHKYTVYFKTDTQSSQEDMYCLKDNSLVETLKNHETNKDKVTITYNNYLFNGVRNCEVGIVGVITGVG